MIGNLRIRINRWIEMGDNMSTSVSGLSATAISPDDAQNIIAGTIKATNIVLDNSLDETFLECVDEATKNVHSLVKEALQQGSDAQQFRLTFPKTNPSPKPKPNPNPKPKS